MAESAGRVAWTLDRFGSSGSAKDVGIRHQHFQGHSRWRREAAADISK